jgi:hypothetical protein
MNLHYELQSIISGTGTTAETNLIQTAANYFRKSKETGRSVEEKQLTNEQETEKLLTWIRESNL